MNGPLRNAAEDLRDGVARFCAAVIGDRLDDAAYTFNALLVDTFEDVKQKLDATLLSTKGKPTQ